MTIVVRTKLTGLSHISCFYLIGIGRVAWRSTTWNRHLCKAEKECPGVSLSLGDISRLTYRYAMHIALRGSMVAWLPGCWSTSNKGLDPLGWLTSSTTLQPTVIAADLTLLYHLWAALTTKSVPAAPEYLSNLSFEYCPRTLLLSFWVFMGTGVFNIVWPALGN